MSFKAENYTGVGFAEEKGLGRTVPLHGASGIEKATTADHIAAKLKRPLYPITCEEIRTYAVTIPTNPREIFSKV